MLNNYFFKKYKFMLISSYLLFKCFCIEVIEVSCYILFFIILFINFIIFDMLGLGFLRLFSYWIFDFRIL